jgi:hypothetical protein
MEFGMKKNIKQENGNMSINKSKRKPQNKVMLIGRICEKFELRTSEKGNKYILFNLAVFKTEYSKMLFDCLVFENIKTNNENFEFPFDKMKTLGYNDKIKIYGYLDSYRYKGRLFYKVIIRNIILYNKIIDYDKENKICKKLKLHNARTKLILN